jgi:hypothetical protein
MGDTPASAATRRTESASGPSLVRRWAAASRRDWPTSSLAVRRRAGGRGVTGVMWNTVISTF